MVGSGTKRTRGKRHIKMKTLGFWIDYIRENEPEYNQQNPQIIKQRTEYQRTRIISNSLSILTTGTFNFLFNLNNMVCILIDSEI